MNNDDYIVVEYYTDNIRISRRYFKATQIDITAIKDNK